jgi:predicted DsbA family dithiol-disulfide isomerase
MKNLSIDVVSDVVCPWCYVGKRRLEGALKAFAEKHPDITTQVRWHTFQLNPDLPSQGIDRADYVRNKFGDRGASVYERVAGVGQEVGLNFAFDNIVRQPNTLIAHSLIAAAEPLGCQAALVEALFHAYFMQGQDLTDSATLVRIAVQVGMAESAAQAVVADEDLHEQTQDADQAARQMGISGVPFFIFNRQVGVSGAHESATLLEAMEQSLQA